MRAKFASTNTLHGQGKPFQGTQTDFHQYPKQQRQYDHLRHGDPSHCLRFAPTIFDNGSGRNNGFDLAVRNAADVDGLDAGFGNDVQKRSKPGRRACFHFARAGTQIDNGSIAIIPNRELQKSLFRIQKFNRALYRGQIICDQRIGQSVRQAFAYPFALHLLRLVRAVAGILGQQHNAHAGMDNDDGRHDKQQAQA